MALPTRLIRLRQFLNRPISSASFPLTTALKIKGLSLIGGAVYLLAKERTRKFMSKDGQPNLGLMVREAIEEERDRWRGFTEAMIEVRKQERREARREAEKEQRERLKRRGGERKGVVLLRRGWPRKPKE